MSESQQTMEKGGDNDNLMWRKVRRNRNFH